MEMHDTFVNNLRTIRRQTGLTQEKLAERCAVSPTFIGEMEIGKRIPSFNTIKKIADALGVKPYRLFLEKQPEMILEEEFVNVINNVIKLLVIVLFMLLLGNNMIMIYDLSSPF